MRITVRYFISTIIILVAISFGLQQIHRGPYPIPPGPRLNTEVRKIHQIKIENQKPGIIFMGDSLLRTDVDVAQFEQLTGESSYKIDIPGSASALWYLILKNNIIPASHTPRVVIIFFRETMLTAPSYRVTGPNFKSVDEFASPKDTLFLQRAYLNNMSLGEQVLGGFFPLYSYRNELKEDLDTLLRHILPELLLNCDSNCADDSYNSLLGSENWSRDMLDQSIGQADEPLYKPEQFEFRARVGMSFLPEMIQLAHQKNIKLIFIRMPIKTYSHKDEPDGIKSYMQALRTYLDANNISLIDLAWDERIKPEYFVDPHHMNRDGMQIFTGILAEAVKDKLK